MHFTNHEQRLLVALVFCISA